MPRTWDEKQFDSLYERFICRDEMHFGGRLYYLRYRSRYKKCVERFSLLAKPGPLDVLDVGGGQLALMCNKLWGDRALMADLAGPELLHKYMASNGVETIVWNIFKSDAPFAAKFDVVFFSEVIEHLPMPGYVALERLRKVLRPGGVIICTTPNLYRLRNVFYMAVGLPIYDYFRIPDDEHSLSHVYEYSRDHLEWHFKKAGLTRSQVEYCQMHHAPTNPFYRVLSWLGYPLFILPRFRDNLIATGYAPNQTN